MNKQTVDYAVSENRLTPTVEIGTKIYVYAIPRIVTHVVTFGHNRNFPIYGIPSVELETAIKAIEALNLSKIQVVQHENIRELFAVYGY
jgi:hypothetical protein